MIDLPVILVEENSFSSIKAHDTVSFIYFQSYLFVNLFREPMLNLNVVSLVDIRLYEMRFSRKQGNTRQLKLRETILPTYAFNNTAHHDLF